MPWGKEERFLRGKKVWHDTEKGRYRIACTHAVLHYESVIDSGVYDTEIDVTPQSIDAAKLGGITSRAAGYEFGYQDRIARQAQKELGSIGFGGRKGESFLNLRPHRTGYLNTRSRQFQEIAGAPVFNAPTVETLQKTIGIGGDDPSIWNLNVESGIDLGSLWSDGRNLANYTVRLLGGQLEPIFTFDNWQSWIANNAPRDRPAATSFGVLMALDLNDIARITIGGVDRNRQSDDFTWSDDLAFSNNARLPIANIGIGQVYVPKRGGSVDIVKRIWRDNVGQWWFFMGANVAQMQKNLLPGQLVIDPPIGTEVIAANNDDAMQNGSTMLLNGYSGNIEYLGGNADYHGGWIFQSVPIGNGDTVNSATLEPYQVGITPGTPTVNVSLYGIEENDAPAFTTTANDITGRSRTAASVALTVANYPGNNVRASWDVAAIVQEIVNNAFWTNNERLGFVGIGTSTTYQYVGFRDYNGSSTLAANFNADVSSGAGPITASGTPSIPVITASGVSNIIKKATGVITVAAITASGIAGLAPEASGTPAIDEIIASGVSTIIKKSNGAAVIGEVTASGVSNLLGVVTSTGSPSIATIVANGLSNLFGGSEGLPAINEVVASGVSSIIKRSSGNPDVSLIIANGLSSSQINSEGLPSIASPIASGISTILKRATGNPSLAEVVASGNANLQGQITSNGTPSLETIIASGIITKTLKPSGTPSIDIISASGVANIVKKSSGALTLPEIEASGVAGFAGVLTSFGSPSIAEIIAAGNVIQRQFLSGAISIDEIAASGVSTIAGVVKPASGTPSIIQIIASGVSSLNVVPPATPTTTYSGKINLDLARPGDIEDPATDRAIVFLHDAVEQLSISSTTEHDELNGVTPDQHHSQAHDLYGLDHEDLDTSAALVTGSVLTYVKIADGGTDKFEAKNVFVARGYGGIQQTGTPGLANLGASFQVVPANVGLIATPLGIIQDPANDGINFEKSGIWVINVTLSLTHSESNQGRSFEVQLYDSTDAVELKAIPVPIARNQPGTLISLTMMAEIPASVEDDLIQIRIGNGSTVTSVVLEAYQFSVNRISEFMG